MGRSLKKGPFVDDHLMVKIEKLNETESKQVVKTSHNLLATQSLFMMVANMCLYMLLKTW
jgi:ribosomal protein S19